MKKRKVHAPRYDPRKEPRIHHLNSGGKLDLPESEIPNIIHHLNLGRKDKSDPNLSKAEKADATHHLSLGGKDKNDPVLNLRQAEKVDITHHLNLEGKDKSDPNLSEAEKADATHHLSPGGEDKNDPRLKTPAATSINELEEPHFEYHRRYGMLCANIALDYFNKKNITKFKLVEDSRFECSPLISSYDTWIICGFSAKEEDSSIKVFFAQLIYDYYLGLSVAICKVLEGDNVDLIVRDLYDEDKNSSDDGLNPDTPDYKPISPYFDEDGFLEFQCLKNTRIAESALNHYNNENRASYELVHADAIENHPFSCTSGQWFHCCFYAVDRSIHNAAISHLFYAEVKYSYPSGPVVYSCEKLTEDNLTRVCEDCYSGIEHPASEDGKYHGRRDRPPKNERPCTTVVHPYDYWDYFGKYNDPRKETSINEPGEHCSRDLRIFGIVFANHALDCYNATNNSDFELVEDGSLDCKPFTCSSGIFINCSFIGRRNFSLKKFSAKLEYAYSSGLTCKVLKTNECLCPGKTANGTHPENDEEDGKHEKDYAGEGTDIARREFSLGYYPPQLEELSLRY